MTSGISAAQRAGVSLKKAGVRAILHKAAYLGVDVGGFKKHSVFGGALNRWTHGGCWAGGKAVEVEGGKATFEKQERIIIETWGGWGLDLRKTTGRVILTSHFKGVKHDLPNGEAAEITLSIQDGKVGIGECWHWNMGVKWDPEPDMAAGWIRSSLGGWTIEHWFNGRCVGLGERKNEEFLGEKWLMGELGEEEIRKLSLGVREGVLFQKPGGARER